MSFFTRQRWILLLAAVMLIAAPMASYAQLGGLKDKAVETLTNGVMKELEKKFADMVAKEALSAAVKADIVNNLSEMSRPIVKKNIDGAASGKLPKQSELVNSVLKDIMPRAQELVAASIAEGGADSMTQVAGQTPTAASASSAISYDDEKDFIVEIINDSNTARITRYAGRNTELRIPPRIGERPVTEIGEKVFVKKGLVSVAIPESVIFIGNMAFADNQIGSVSIGANVYIANNAFDSLGYNSFSAGFYNSQGRRAGTYSNSWRLVSAASPGTSAGTTGTAASASATQTTTAQQPTALVTPPESAVVFAGNGHSYEVIDKTMNWTQARDDCEKRGGYLVTITSKEEQEFIKNLLLKHGKKDIYWLGGYREGKGWQWVTGEDFTYKNWTSGKPDNAGGFEDKLIMLRVSLWGGSPGKWDDVNRSTTGTGYICEWDSWKQ